MRKFFLILTLVLLAISTLSFGVYTRQLKAQSSSDSVTVQKQPESSVATQLEKRAKASWPWYVTRISGIVAAVSLILLMLSGIGFITGDAFNFFEPITGWASHRALGLSFGFAVILHVGALYFDNFVPFSIMDLLVPFYSDYKPVTILGYNVGSLFIAEGVISLYLVAFITITSLLWVEKKPYLWKLVHLLSYMVIIMIFVHALYLGTDFASGILRYLWIAIGVFMLYAMIVRLWRAKTV